MNDLIFKPITDATEPVSKAVGGTITEVWQALIGDKVTAWRIRNAQKVDAALRQHLAATGTSLVLENLPEGTAYRWFQRATEADEPEIQELFAKLLANAASGNEDALRKRNIELVSNLTPDEARLLDFIADRFVQHLETPRAMYQYFAMNYDFQFMQHYAAAGFQSELPIDALLSMGVLRHDRQFKQGRRVFSSRPRDLERRRDIEIDISGALDQDEMLTLTEVGKSLLAALFPERVAPAVVN